MSAVPASLGAVAPPEPSAPQAPRRGWRRASVRTRPWRVIVLGLALIFYLGPLLASFKFSLIDAKGNYSASNYTTIVTNHVLLNSLVLSLEIAGLTAVIVALLVLPTAVLVRLKLPKMTIVMEAITILPIVVPPIVLAAGLLQMKETAPLWLVNLFFDHPLTILTPIYVILAMPLVYRAVDTGLRAIDLHTLVDASRSLGASWPRTLWRIVLPNVQTAVLGGMFLSIAMVLGEVVISNLIDQSHLTLPLEMIQFSQQDNAPGVSVALTLAALVFTFLLLFLLTFLTRRRGARSAGVI